MKQLLAIFLFFVALYATGQKLDSLKKDSTTNVSLRILSGLPLTDIQSNSSYIVAIGQMQAMKFYSGVSILNVQRGLVPGLNVGVSPFITSSSRHLIIDGMALNETSIGAINLNSFDFVNAAVLARGNAAAVLGGNSAMGVIAVTSKNGRGYLKPTVEVNSFTDMSWADEQTQNRYWYLSNSVAFMQDFGKIDVRVSANNIQQPQNQYAGERPDLNQFKINAGYDITDRLTSRVILEHTFNKSEQKYTSYLSGTQNPAVYDQTTRRGYFGGNLTLEYKALDWLKVSAQAVENRFFSNLKRESIYSSTSDRDRHTYNLISTAEHRIGDFAGSASLGISFEEIETEQSSKSSSSNWGSLSQRLKSNLQRKSALGSFQVGFRNYAFIQSSARWDDVEFSASPNITNQFSFSAGGSFIFSDAFNIPARYLSSGKVRGTFAKFNGCACMQYPYAEGALSGTGTSSLTKRTQTTSTEFGTDLAWFNNRLTLTYNYFTGVVGSPSTPTVIDPSTGYTVTFINGDFDVKNYGHEIILGGDILKGKNWNLQSSLIWSQIKSEVLNNQTDISDIVLRGFIARGNFASGNLPNPIISSLGNPNPDWTGSWLNQLTYKNLSLRVLVDYSKGGYFYASQTNFIENIRGNGGFILPGVNQTGVNQGSPLLKDIPRSLNNFVVIPADYGFNGNFNGSEIGIEDKSFVKLREVSLGYQLPSKWLKNTFISVTGRNLLLFYAKAPSDPEATDILSPYSQKGVSLNLMAKF